MEVSALLEEKFIQPDGIQNDQDDVQGRKIQPSGAKLIWAPKKMCGVVEGDDKKHRPLKETLEPPRQDGDEQDHRSSNKEIGELDGKLENQQYKKS
jgi:hypothetical protein